AGSITTVHANTARDALARLETMVLMAGFELPVRAIREQIASAINVIVQFVPRIGADGHQVGEVEAAGLRPKFLDALVHSGVDLPANVFQAPVRVREV